MAEEIEALTELAEAAVATVAGVAVAVPVASFWADKLKKDREPKEQDDCPCR